MVDPAEEGAGFACFDTTPLLSFARVGRLDILGAWFPRAFVPNVVMEEEVKAHVGKHPENQEIVDAAWLESVPVEEDEDLELVAYLLEERWASAEGKDRGEAEVVALCRRHRWLAILDDTEGRKAAADYVVRHISFLGVIVGAAAQGMLKPTDAWNLHVEIDQARKRIKPQSFSFLTSDTSAKPVFMDAVNAVRKAWIAAGRPDWHALLLMDDPTIDRVLLQLRKRL
jgi:predicted nucleic acid-binding protein